jgi:ubiquinone/menaquinone biosynthesis C-methylase UbiE
MSFSIEQAAREYIPRRFPRASHLEQEKYILDWKHKVKVSKAVVRDFAQRVGDPAGKKVLDAGCGNGGISIALALAGAQVSGVEIEPELHRIALEHAQALEVQPELILYDGAVLPFPDNFFDYALSTSVLEHTDDPVLYLEQILRVTKLGGKLYLGFPNKLTFREAHTRLLFLTYLPAFLQPYYIKLFRRNPLPDNNLHFYGYFDLQWMLQQIKSQGRDAYNAHWQIIEERGMSQSRIKNAIKRLLKALGLSYKAFLPQILVVLEKKQYE